MATIPEKEVVVAPVRRQGMVASIVAYRARGIAWRAVTYVVLILLALVTIFPLVWMLSTSVKDPQDVFSGSLLPTTIRLSNYQQVWIDIDIPRQVILIPMFTFLKGIGLLNTLPGLSLSYLGGSLPFAIFLMRAFFKTLPRELADAGKIDGCSDVGVFARIFLPLARPGIATITIFQFVGTWNEFMFA